MKIPEEVISDQQRNELAVKDLNLKLDVMLQEPEFSEYLKALSNNKLVTELKEQIALMSGESVAKTYGKRKAIIITALLAGAIVSSIGSLTFLVGEQFPKEFGQFAGIATNDNAVDETGKFLGWTNVAIEAIFYTWTVYGILPPLQPEPKPNIVSMNNKSGVFRRCYEKITSYLPSIGEWTLGVASTIPLTFLSLIDEEKKDEQCPILSALEEATDD